MGGKKLQTICGLMTLLLLSASSLTAEARSKPFLYALGDQKDFWVWDLTVMPPAFRKTTATVQAVGNHSYVFVENTMWNSGAITPDLVSDVEHNLEDITPNGSLNPNLGIIPLEEQLFAPLPTLINSDPRLVVLFANLGQYKDYQFDGFFNSYDQMAEGDAEAQGQHSNEENIIYMNGLRKDEEYTLSVISHEFQHLLASNATSTPAFTRDSWFSEMLAEGAMLLTGYYDDQDHVNAYASTTAQYPLVTEDYVQYGPQILFASFLIDSIKQNDGGLGYLTKQANPGRTAVENVFQAINNTTLNFDAIYSNFVSYIFSAASSQSKLPLSKEHNDNSGLTVPAIPSLGLIDQLPKVIENQIYPYSFTAFNLTNELPATAVVKVEALPTPNSNCGNASLLWKPINPKWIAIYAVGCEPTSSTDTVKFRLTILDRPSIFVRSPLKIAL